jgi:hypothetical protein
MSPVELIVATGVWMLVSIPGLIASRNNRRSTSKKDSGA